MSALPPKADVDQHGRNVRFVPKADIHQKRIRPSSFERSEGWRRSRAGSCAASAVMGDVVQSVAGRLFLVSDKDFVHHIEHADPKLLWHRCKPGRGVQSSSGVGKSLLPSHLHGRAAELEIL